MVVLLVGVAVEVEGWEVMIAKWCARQYGAGWADDYQDRLQDAMLAWFVAKPTLKQEDRVPAMMRSICESSLKSLYRKSVAIKRGSTYKHNSYDKGDSDRLRPVYEIVPDLRKPPTDMLAAYRLVRDALTPRGRSILDLRAQGLVQHEIADRLRLQQSQVSDELVVVRTLLEYGSATTLIEERREKYNARTKEWKANNREETRAYNNRWMRKYRRQRRSMKRGK